MKFKLEIVCDNAAFEGQPGHEVARILRDATSKIDRGDYESSLRDINGNTVGKFFFTKK